MDDRTDGERLTHHDGSGAHDLGSLAAACDELESIETWLDTVTPLHQKLNATIRALQTLTNLAATAAKQRR